jgi:hypothetical protein
MIGEIKDLFFGRERGRWNERRRYAAEGALADAERLLGWRPVGYELDANRAAMTPALEDQARSDCFRRALHTRLSAAR